MNRRDKGLCDGALSGAQPPFIPRVLILPGGRGNVLLVLARRYAAVREDTAQAWSAVREDMRDFARIHRYVRRLRRCDRLRATMQGLLAECAEVSPLSQRILLGDLCGEGGGL